MVQSLAESLLFTRLTEMPSDELFAVAGGTAAVFSSRSPVRETDNEDAAVVIPLDADRAVLAVADGVGGHLAGADAAERAPRALTDCVEAGDAGEDSLRTGIVNGLEAANQAVSALGVGAGTTLAIVEVNGRTVRPYHVGDSVILVVGQRGRLRFQSVPHSPIGYAVEAGLLDATEAIHHKDRHLVSNIVGTPEMRIDIGPVLTLRPRDTLVLGSDGLFDNLHVEEVVRIIRCGPLPRVVRTLAETCRQRMTLPEPGHPSKPDDVTFVIYRPQPPQRRGSQATPDSTWPT